MLSPIDNEEIERIKAELAETVESKRQRILMQVMGAILGSIPWIGGFLSAGVNFKTGEKQVKTNQLYERWFEEHERKMVELFSTVASVFKRLNEFSDEIDSRLESEEYLTIVRKSFRIWDTSDTQEKKEIIRRLVTNAGAYSMVEDDLVRLFLDWINTYHEIHFAVIRSIHQNEGITRHAIWNELNGMSVREDSSEADVFKLLIRDLSTGGVIRQHRAKDYNGSYFKRSPARKSSSSSTMKSAFDDVEQYELTELGRKFVHYTMSDLVERVGDSEQTD